MHKQRRLKFFMFKRLLAALCAVALCTAMVGCGKTDPAANPDDQTTQQQEQQGETKQVTLYLPDEQGESVVPTQTEISLGGQDEAAALMAALVGEGVLPAEVAVNSLNKDEDNNLTLDVNAAFAEALSSSGTTGETMIIASVADTFLAYYGAASLLITVDGGTLETGHAVYDEPFTQIFDAAPAA